MKLIEGVRTKRLKVIPDERGRLMEILRRDEDLFEKFGQVYMTTTLPGVVKAWHLHQRQNDHVACLRGMIKLALYDSRENSPTYRLINQFYLGIHQPDLVKIPAGVYHGWKCVSLEEALIINLPTEVYDYEHPDEIRLDPHTDKIPYDWARKDG